MSLKRKVSAEKAGQNTGKTVLELYPSKHNCRNSEGSFIRLKDGRIMFAYSRFGGDGGHDSSPACIAARYSDDGGLTWTAKDRILVKKNDDNNVMSVTLLRLQDGRIALFYLRRGIWPEMRLAVRFSSDEGETWTEPSFCINAPGYYVVNNDRVIQTSTGRLIVPAAFHRCKKIPGSMRFEDGGFDGRAISIFFLSDDAGATWREAKDWCVCTEDRRSAGLQEPGVVELEDGRLFAYARTGLGCQYGMYSCDQGETWSVPAPTQFLAPCSPLSIKRIPSNGALLAVWNDKAEKYGLPEPKDGSWGRTPLVMAVSYDEGVSWTKHRVLESESDHGYCYIAIHFTDDDHVLLAYCAGGLDTGCVLNMLRIRRISLAGL